MADKKDKPARKAQVRNPDLIVFVIVDTTKQGKDAVVNVVKNPMQLVKALEGKSDLSFVQYKVERQKKNGTAAVAAAA